jgi:D-lyxose ketol-isomerase
MASVETKSWSSPDGSMTPDKTHAATINFGGVTLTKANMQPGWKWSECIKPHVGTESCQAGHGGVLIQGQIHVVSDDGSEVTVKAGDAYCLAPGHDGWVVGEEPAVGVEFSMDNKDFGPWTHGDD